MLDFADVGFSVACVSGDGVHGDVGGGGIENEADRAGLSVSACQDEDLGARSVRPHQLGRAARRCTHMPRIARLGRSVGLAAGQGGCGNAPARAKTRSASSSVGIQGAVTNSGRLDDPRTAGTASGAVRNGTWPPRSLGSRSGGNSRKWNSPGR
jgi:hypothetical protein